MVDVDHFKPYNDFLGHPAGDACLQKLGELIGGSHLRASDVAARYGGEEFVLILPDTDADGARRVAERLRERVAAAELLHPTAPRGQVTVSLGVATAVPTATDGPESLLRRADEALYTAKQRGRDRCEVASTPPGAVTA